MALRPAEHFTEFNLAMWSLSFSRVTVNRFERYYAQAVLIANIRWVKKTQYLLK